MTIEEYLPGCKVTHGECMLVEGPPDRRGEATRRLQASDWEVTLKWASDASFGVLATRLGSKTGVV